VYKHVKKKKKKANIKKISHAHMAVSKETVLLDLNQLQDASVTTPVNVMPVPLIVKYAYPGSATYEWFTLKSPQLLPAADGEKTPAAVLQYSATAPLWSGTTLRSPVICPYYPSINDGIMLLLKIKPTAALAATDWLVLRVRFVNTDVWMPYNEHARLVIPEKYKYFVTDESGDRLVDFFAAKEASKQIPAVASRIPGFDAKKWNKKARAAALVDVLLAANYEFSGTLEPGQSYPLNRVGMHVFVRPDGSTRTIRVYGAIRTEKTEFMVKMSLAADGSIAHEIENSEELTKIKQDLRNSDAFWVHSVTQINPISFSRTQSVDVDNLDVAALVHRLFQLEARRPGAIALWTIVGVSPQSKLPTKINDMDLNEIRQMAYLMKQTGIAEVLSGVVVSPPSDDTKASAYTQLLAQAPTPADILFQQVTSLWRVRVRIAGTSLEMDKPPAFPRLRNPPMPDLETRRKLYLQVLLAQRAGLYTRVDSKIEFVLKHYELIARNRTNFNKMAKGMKYSISSISGHQTIGDYLATEQTEYFAVLQIGTLEGVVGRYENYPLESALSPGERLWRKRIEKKTKWTADDVIDDADLNLLQYVEENAGTVLHTIDNAPLLMRMLAGEIVAYSPDLVSEMKKHIKYARFGIQEQIDYISHCRMHEPCTRGASNALDRIEAVASDEGLHSFSVYFKEFQHVSAVKAALRNEDQRLLSLPSFTKMLEGFLTKMELMDDARKSAVSQINSLETLALCLRRYMPNPSVDKRIEDLYEKARALAFVTRRASPKYDEIAEKLQVLDSLFVTSVKTWLDKLHEVTVARREVMATLASEITSARELIGELNSDLNDPEVLSAIAAWKPTPRLMRIGTQFDTATYTPLAAYANSTHNPDVIAASAQKALSISDLNEILNSNYFERLPSLEQKKNAKLHWYLYAMLLYIGEKPLPDVRDADLANQLFVAIGRTRWKNHYRAVMRIMAMAYAAADAVWTLDRTFAVSLLLFYFQKTSEFRKTFSELQATPGEKIIGKLQNTNYITVDLTLLPHVRAQLQSTFENRSFADSLARIDALLRSLYDQTTVDFINAKYGSGTYVLDTFNRLASVKFLRAPPDPLGTASVKQTTFFRTSSHDSDLPPALNTYFVAEPRPDITETSISAFVWKNRLDELRADLKQHQPPASSIFTPQASIDRIMGRWTGSVIARYAIAQALRESGQSAVPVDALEEVVFALLSNPEFEPWLRTHLGAVSIGADKILGFAHVVSARFAENRQHQRDGDAFLQVTEELAMALFNALMKQREDEVLKFGKLAESRYGYTTLQAHEFWRMAVFGTRPDAYMWHPSKIDPSRSSITTTEVQQQIRALTEMDRVLELVLKKAAPTTQTLPRIDVLHSCLTFVLSYLRTSPLWRTTPLFSLALGGKGEVVFYDFNGAVVPFIAGLVYNYPRWKEEDDGGMQSACLLLNRPLTKWRREEFLRLVYGLEPRRPEEPSLGLTIEMRRAFDLLCMRSYATQYYQRSGSGPIIADRILVRDDLQPQPFTAHTDATPRVYAHSGNGWMDISPLSNLEQFEGVRFPLFQKNEQYSRFDWHTFQRTYYPVELAMQNEIKSPPLWVFVDSETSSSPPSTLIEKLLDTELLLPPHTPFFYALNFLLSLTDDAWLELMPQVVAEVDSILSTTPTPGPRPKLLRQYLTKKEQPPLLLQRDVAFNLLGRYSQKLDELVQKFKALAVHKLGPVLGPKVQELEDTVLAVPKTEFKKFGTAISDQRADEAFARRVADALDKANVGLTAYETYLPSAGAEVDTVNKTFHSAQLDFPLYKTHTAPPPAWLSFPSGLFF
jgi:hypothetical protein